MALNAANVRVGAGRVYMGTTAPAAGQHINLPATGIPATGTEVGLTEGEAVFTYEVTYFEVNAEQSLAPVEVFATEESAQLEFTMKEYIQANIEDFFNTMLATGVDAVPTDAGTPVYTDIYEGGRILGLAAGAGEVTLQSCILVAPIPNTSAVAQRYTYIMLYQAYQSEAAAVRYTKSGDSLMKVTMKAIADLTRGDTSTLFQVAVERN